MTTATSSMSEIKKAQVTPKSKNPFVVVGRGIGSGFQSIGDGIAYPFVKIDEAVKKKQSAHPKPSKSKKDKKSDKEKLKPIDDVVKLDKDGNGKEKDDEPQTIAEKFQTEMDREAALVAKVSKQVLDSMSSPFVTKAPSPKSVPPVDKFPPFKPLIVGMSTPPTDVGSTTSYTLSPASNGNGNGNGNAPFELPKPIYETTDVMSKPIPQPLPQDQRGAHEQQGFGGGSGIWRGGGNKSSDFGEMMVVKETIRGEDMLLGKVDVLKPLPLTDENKALHDKLPASALKTSPADWSAPGVVEGAGRKEKGTGLCGTHVCEGTNCVIL